MVVAEGKITIKYRTRKDTCRCCHRSFEEPEFSGVREFDFYERNFEEYSTGYWKAYTDAELREVVEEFVYDTIDFYAVSNHEPIILSEGEMERMHQFAKSYIERSA